MSFFQLFKYCLGSGKCTIGDFASEQLPNDPKFCITFVFHFSWVLQPSQEKLKTMLMQNFMGGGGGKWGESWKMRKWRMGPTWCQKRITGGIRLCCWVPTICFTDGHNLIRRSNNSMWDRVSFLKKYYKPQSQNPFGRDKNWKMWKMRCGRRTVLAPGE